MQSMSINSPRYTTGGPAKVLDMLKAGSPEWGPAAADQLIWSPGVSVRHMCMCNEVSRVVFQALLHSTMPNMREREREKNCVREGWWFLALTTPTIVQLYYLVIVVLFASVVEQLPNYLLLSFCDSCFANF